MNWPCFQVGALQLPSLCMDLSASRHKLGLRNPIFPAYFGKWWVLSHDLCSSLLLGETLITAEIADRPYLSNFFTIRTETRGGWMLHCLLQAEGGMFLVLSCHLMLKEQITTTEWLPNGIIHLKCVSWHLTEWPTCTTRGQTDEQICNFTEGNTFLPLSVSTRRKLCSLGVIHTWFLPSGWKQAADAEENVLMWQAEQDAAAWLMCKLAAEEVPSHPGISVHEWVQKSRFSSNVNKSASARDYSNLFALNICLVVRIY